jgi:hypothetical protein
LQDFNRGETDDIDAGRRLETMRSGSLRAAPGKRRDNEPEVPAVGALANRARTYADLVRAGLEVTFIEQ